MSARWSIKEQRHLIESLEESSHQLLKLNGRPRKTFPSDFWDRIANGLSMLGHPKRSGRAVRKKFQSMNVEIQPRLPDQTRVAVLEPESQIKLQAQYERGKQKYRRKEEGPKDVKPCVSPTAPTTEKKWSDLKYVDEMIFSDGECVIKIEGKLNGRYVARSQLKTANVFSVSPSNMKSASSIMSKLWGNGEMEKY